jgi:hypothetical protein
MLISPPKVFLDTQILIDVGRGTIAPDDWSRVVLYLRDGTRYSISPLTLGELISGLVNGEEEHFERNRRPLRIALSPDANAEVFDFLPYFLAGQLGVDFARPPHLEDDFLGSIGLILEAPSRAACLEGFRRPQSPGQTAKVRIDRLAREHADTLGKYFEFMARRREDILAQRHGLGPFQVAPDAWASFILGSYGVAAMEHDCSEAAERLSAAYEFEMHINTLMKSETFSVEKNRGDLVDGQQLFYLFDSSTVFVTNDSRIKLRTARSPQSHRIKTFSDLLACAESGLSLL